MHVHSEELDNSFVAVQDLGSKYKKLVWGCSSTVEHLPHMFEALGSVLSTAKQQQKQHFPTPHSKLLWVMFLIIYLSFLEQMSLFQLGICAVIIINTSY
jgi:hypothetical protein